MLLKPYISRIDRIREIVKTTRSPIAFAVLGRILLKERKREEAELVLKFSHRENRLSAFFYCKYLLENKKPEEARPIIEDLVERYPLALGVRKLYAQILSAVGESERAKEQLDFISCFISEEEQAEETEIITPEIVEALIMQCMFHEAKEKLLLLERRNRGDRRIEELKNKLNKYMEMLEPER